MKSSRVTRVTLPAKTKGENELKVKLQHTDNISRGIPVVITHLQGKS